MMIINNGFKLWKRGEKSEIVDDGDYRVMEMNMPVITPPPVDHWHMDFHYVGCNCFSPTHMVRVSPDDDGSGNLIFEVVTTKNGSFWTRLKVVWRYLFSGDPIVEGDVIVSPAEFIKLHRKFKEHLNHHLMKQENKIES